jgi:hypothetical protein
MYKLNALIISESRYKPTVWMANLSAPWCQIHIKSWFPVNYCQQLCILQYCLVVCVSAVSEMEHDEEFVMFR